MCCYNVRVEGVELSLQIAPCELAIKTDSHGTICSDNLLGLAESHRVNGKIVTTFVGQTELLPCTSQRCEVVTTSIAYKLSRHIAPCELALSFIKRYTVSESFTNKTNNNNNNRCHNVTSLCQLRRKTTLYDVSHKDGLFFFS